MSSEKRTSVPNSLNEHWMPFSSNKDFKKNPRIIVKAEGIHLHTHDGKTLIDGSSGLYCNPLGHGRKEIIEAIKNQLENKDYNPNVDDSSPIIRVSSLKNKSDFDELKLKIESLEKKINTIDTFLNNKSSIKEVHEPTSKKLDGDLSIFHKLDNQSSIQQNKSLLVLEDEGNFNSSNFNLFRFIMTINFLKKST